MIKNHLPIRLTVQVIIWCILWFDCVKSQGTTPTFTNDITTWLTNKTSTNSDLNNNDDNDVCRVPKPIILSKNGTVGIPRVYMVGANSWHIPTIDYMTDVIGNEFDPPIEFVRETANTYLKTPNKTDSLSLGYDFMIANPYASSCFESEGNTIGLATQVFIDYDDITGIDYNLTEYGAVLYTLKSRNDIQSVNDIPGKKIGTNKITSLATHLCYDVLLRNGVHHLQDPEQTIFFKDSQEAIQALLDGKIDVGCAATNQIEKFVDPVTEERVDIIDKLRFLNTVQYEMDDTGETYPYAISSRLVPQYQVSVYPHVEQSVYIRFQEELLAMRDHADVAPSLIACLDSNGCFTNNTDCLTECFNNLEPGIVKRCDTTPERAIKAHEALVGSKSTAYVKFKQNLILRDIQETTGFLIKDPDDGPRCVRMNNIVDAVTCPPGHFARSSEEIVNECNVTGLPCYDSDCICNPCVEKFEVDFFPIPSFDDDNEKVNITGSGCSKFSICGTVQQEHVISFKAVDNMGRKDTNMTGAFLLADESEETFDFTEINGTFYYDYYAKRIQAGQKIVKIRINNEEIPESPFRINVIKRDCAVDTGDDRHEPDLYGQCVCKKGYVDIFDECVKLWVLLVSIMVPSFFLFLLAVHFYVKHKRDQADKMWKVDPGELKFGDDPKVLGHGTFGVVLLAEYRGTPVAVKRVMPPDEKKKGSSSGVGGRKSMIGHRSPMQSIASNIEQNPAFISRSGSSSSVDGSVSLRGTGSTSLFGSRSLSFNCNNGNQMVPAFLTGKLTPPSSSWRKKFALMENAFVEEMRLLSTLRHPCITTVMGAVFNSKTEPMLVMEYMHFGSLYDLLHNESMILDGEQVVGFLKDVASGLRFLHSSEPPVLHGDLKSQNILVDDKFRAKVADFGLSSRGGLRKQRARGTPYWMAPELLRGDTINTKESDVYAFGIVLYEVFSRKEPYAGEHYDEVLQLVSDPTVNKRPSVPEGMPSEVASLMKHCFDADPSQRPTATDLDVSIGLMDGANVQLHEVTSKRRKNSGNSDALLEEFFPAHIAKALREGRKTEPEKHESVTIVFSDIVGYTNIASTMCPTKVSNLLERLYGEFDKLTERLEVFKVETIGDAYMIVTNLVKNQPHHASLAARYAVEAMRVASTVAIDLDDPSAGFVKLRMGFHSGPVVTHVVGTKNARFTLIGDTVNTASRMESNSKPGKIHCSEASYKLLCKDTNHVGFKIEKRGTINVKGKGDMVTYWVDPSGSLDLIHKTTTHKLKSLIDWNIDTLEKLIEAVVAHNDTTNDPLSDAKEQAPPQKMSIGSAVDRTMMNISFDMDKKPNEISHKSMKLDPAVKDQLVQFVTHISNMYNDHAFHSFEHASHVAMSAIKLLSELPPNNALTIDPLAQFAIVFACMVHNINHAGVQNAVLVREKTRHALIYEGRSVQEQNSINMAWSLLEDERFQDLLNCVCPTPSHLQRFYDLFVKALLSTDLVDKELKALRQENWKKGFSQTESDDRQQQNYKANATLELVMQAADISHTLQQWPIFQKWNRRLYIERSLAHAAGRTAVPGAPPPHDGWFNGELKFFDIVVLPLAQQMVNIGLPPSYLICATKNKEQWLVKGNDVLDEARNILAEIKNDKPTTLYEI